MEATVLFDGYEIKRGCRLILIFKAPTPKQAYPADFLAFQQRTFCGICLFFFTSPILGRKIPFLHICSSALAAKLSFDRKRLNFRYDRKNPRLLNDPG